MYYEEKIINGVLCYRHSPNDAWTECSKEELTLMVQNARNKYNLIREILDQYEILYEI
jgi:hypothetical protein